MRLPTVVLTAAAVLAALAACSPKSPDAPQLPQPTTLTRATQEGPTTACPGGGLRVDVGLDDGSPGGTARDGILDPQEIDTTVRICGATEALVKVSAEPAGVHCAAGGSRVDVGVDDGAGGGIAANGLLEPGEIDRTTWICNGAIAPGTCVASSGAPALDVAVAVSTPANGLAFLAGEQPVLSIRFVDACGATASLGSVSRAQLFLTGPRRGVNATATAASLLNCVTDRAALDRQHHYVDLRSPHYADPAHPNLAVAPDGLLVYTLAPVSAEAAGTYTAAVWADTADGAVQLFRLADLQIGTSTPEPDGFGGTGAGSTCAGCHLGPDAGRIEMAHSFPSASTPLAPGHLALDAAPVAGCAACHNAAGYSVSPLVRKAHGVHRGVHLAAPGEARLDYGLAADPSLPTYLDVTYPVVPGAEKDCASCHTDDRWTTAPSRLACGTCHDAVHFAEGTLVPPRVVPVSPPCATDVACAPLGALLTCNTGTGACERQTHPPQTDDVNCAGCHTADGSGVSPIRARHEILERTRVPGLALRNVVLSGGTGAGGAFQVGDTPVLDFGLDATAGPVTDLRTNSALSASFTISGPTTSPQRVYGQTTMKTSGTLTFDSGTGRYHYVAPTSFPATSLAPVNSDTAPPVSNAPGTYRVVLWVSESLTVGTTAVRDAATVTIDFPFTLFTPSGPTRGRDVVTDAACNACHGTMQYHGGTRRTVAGCVSCHTAGATDRGVGARGAACVSDSNCPGFALGNWSSCISGACQIVIDPTPGRSVALADLIHRIHAARLLGGWSGQLSLAPYTGRLVYIGTGNTPVDFSDRLLPVDRRNCTVCHADTGTSCATDDACGVGQACVSGRCRNRSWTVPSTAACLGCHDTASAAAHAALETWTPYVGAQPIEACDTCHGATATASVASAHRLTDPTVPLQPREP